MINNEEFKLNTIDEAIEQFRKGEFVIVVDDEDRGLSALPRRRLTS